MPRTPDEPIRKIVRAIMEVGVDNYSEISRRTGIPESTVRYNIKNLQSKGLIVNPIIDYGRLGLSHHWAFLELEPTYRPYSQQLFEAINQAGYLTYYVRLFPKGHYIALFAIPLKIKKEYMEFLDALLDEGVFKNYEIYEVGEVLHPPMRVEFYDFDQGVWNIEWNRLRETPNSYRPYAPSKPERIDYIDLLILKELQIDPIRPLTDIADKLSLNSKTLHYHYKTHVKPKIIKGYYAVWVGYADRRHLIHYPLFWFKDITHKELTCVQKVFHSLPLTWSISLSSDRRFCLQELAVPATDLIDLLGYIYKHVEVFAEKLDWAIRDVPSGAAYTLPYNMFKDGEWWFNLDLALQRIRLVMMLIQ
jgi:DNA-binding Lrp family transcriptional regulator